MKNLEIKNAQLVELSNLELQKKNGGNWISLLWDIGFGYHPESSKYLA